MDLSKISVVVLFIVTMASCLAGGILKNYFSKSISSTTRGYQLFNMATSFVCALVIFAYSGFNLSGSTYTIILGIAFGTVTALAAIFNLAAVSIGPLSYTTVIISCSTVITALSGLFFGEYPTIFQWIGIVLMMACLILSIKKESDSSKKKASFKWFVLSILAAVSSAGVGLLQKVHQESKYSSELSLLLFIAFVFSTVFSLVLYLISLRKDPPVISKKASGGSFKKALVLIIVIFVIAGVAAAFNNIINLYLVGVMPSAVLFPIVNGGHLILTTIAGVILFREKLSPKQWIGILCGIAATFFLCF